MFSREDESSLGNFCEGLFNLEKADGRILILPPQQGSATSATRSTSACNVAAETSKHLRVGEPAATRRVALRSRIPRGFRPKAQRVAPPSRRSGAIPPSPPSSARSRRSEAETEARREGGRHELPWAIVRQTSPTATRLRPIRY